MLDPAKLAVGLRPPRCAPASGCTSTRPRSRSTTRRRVTARRAHPGRRRARPARAAGDQRLPAAAARDPPLRRAGLRLRADDRAADRRAAEGDPVAATARDRRRRQPVPLLPPSADDRILWGGYDAVYRFRGPVRDDLDDHDATFGRLAQNFFATFPQLEGLRFGHRWGGAIDTCSRFSVFFGTARQGRVAYATGYTGLGVAATRWGARVALDLVDGRDTEATRSRYVRRKPVPFPPEPLRTARDPAHPQPPGGRGPPRRPPRSLARRARPARARLQQLRLSAEAAGRPSCRRAGGRSSTRPSRSGRSSWTAGPAPFARSARCRGRRRARSRRCRPACPARP